MPSKTGLEKQDRARDGGMGEPEPHWASALDAIASNAVAKLKNRVMTTIARVATVVIPIVHDDLAETTLGVVNAPIQDDDGLSSLAGISGKR
ncbi:hypothetical protein NUW58_g948 [Xylaria curta]|uniref:Uncharacterized protein n=1 Tax=Xylaria curta TaxID=42375 RepID=A0ACC1PNW7_9PEZI|nr:hypothetical protein NUW58_g948 [Xylaria curta]